VPALDLSADVIRLTAALVDVPSESHHEKHLADLVEQALTLCSHLTVERLGNTIVAMTNLGHAERVLIGGHLDTVPSAGNLPHSLDGDLLYGLGACDMKGGVAVALKLAHGMTEPTRDVTYVLYEGEEVAAEFNGLQLLADARPDLLEADLAILMEPSGAGIEAGCQGTLRVEVRIPGVRSHSARSWMGVNAVHGAAEVLGRLGAYLPARPVVDGLEYREGLSAVGIRGGIAGNVIPDECIVTVNYRFAPDKSVGEAIAHVRAVFEGYEVTVVDEAPAARPGLHLPAAVDFVAAVGADPRPKFGWTDVARFAELGVPALNFGPGDPSLAHAADEHVPVEQIRSCLAHLERWLAR
jgi:succinyl-diaminopimelate desuccinylase